MGFSVDESVIDDEISVTIGSIVAIGRAIFVNPGVEEVMIQEPSIRARDSSFFGTGLLFVP